MSDGPGAARADRVILIGMPGAGKSSVGTQLALRWGWRFADLDEEVVARTGRSIPEWFAEAGEQGFRAAETEALRAVLAWAPLVLACGGGTLGSSENRRRIRAAGWVVHLRARLRTLVARTAGGGRPLLANAPEKRLRELLVRRRRVYARCADLIVQTDGRSPGEVAAEIDARLRAAQGHRRELGLSTSESGDRRREQ